MTFFARFEVKLLLRFEVKLYISLVASPRMFDKFLGRCSEARLMNTEKKSN